MSTRPPYRRDIDGLRAIAVLSVVVYHAQPEALPGGYLGVDIFFVLSGYLITQIIAQEMLERRFSIGVFYTRRLRRLFPAFAAMIACTLVLGWFVLLPQDYTDAAKSAFAALFAVSNYHFASKVGYFAPAAETLPLLHTWSLAVEEQFYLVMPVLLWAALRISRRAALMTLLSVGAGSFALAMTVTGGDAFFLPQTRFWELFSGAALALVLGTRAGFGDGAALSRRADLAVVLALVLLLVFFLSPAARWASAWGHPGPGTLPVVAATIMILGYGSRSALARIALENRPMVFVGLISYSLYLWHAPILALRHNIPLGLPHGAEIGGALALTFLLAVASWRFVERPFRGTRSALAGRRFAAASALVMVSCVLASGVVVLSRGMPGRLPPEVIEMVAGARRSTESMACHERAMLRDPCTLNPDADGPTVYVLGDSHAFEAAYEIALLLRDRKVVPYTHNGCNPAQGFQRTSSTPGCADFLEHVVERFAADAKADQIILISRWSRPLYLPNSTVPLVTYPQITLDGRAVNDAERNDRMLQAYRDLIEDLLATGKSVVLVHPVPELPRPVPRTAATALWWGQDVRGAVGVSRSETEERHRLVRKMFDEIATRDKVIEVPVLDLFCDIELCTALDMVSGLPLFFDGDHVNTDGARLIASRIAQALEALP